MGKYHNNTIHITESEKRKQALQLLENWLQSLDKELNISKDK
ncbi:hypothetical protein [Robertmurraya siralis]|nr:hypothetical protein [Robertmurraya siralis]